MKKSHWLVITALLLSATPVFAGLRYEFTETHRTEETGKSTRLVARAVLEGEMSRMDILSGNKYQPGSYMLSHGDKRIYVLDPETKSYFEYATDRRSVNPDRVKITNLKSNFTEVTDPAPTVIAGYPTKHYRLQLAYDITVLVGTISIKQSVETSIDKWTTQAFDELIKAYRDNTDDLKTGNAEIDALIETEASKFKGLTLKELTQTTTQANQKNRKSNINLPSTRKRVKEMVVSKIEEVTVSPNFFAIPTDYTKGQATKAPGTTTQYLTMEPDGHEN